MSASALWLDPARTLDPAAYALGGRAPRLALRPASAEEVGEALAAATGDGLAVVPWGGGSKLAGGPLPRRYDLALDLTALDRVIEYDPEDLTLTAQCGARLAALREVVSARGQELPLESAHAERATLGGVLATNDSGPRRLRLGSPRDRILGARFALADGTLARSGGRVVKNVAGFAIHRLLCGSRGGLAVLLEASLKLLPAPETRLALVYDVTRERLADVPRWAFLPRLEPSYVTVLGAEAARGRVPQADAAAPFSVVIGLEDDDAWVAEQEQRVVTALGAPVARLAGTDAANLAQSLADATDTGHARVTFTSSHNLPASLAPIAGREEAPRLVFHAPAGRLHWFTSAADATAVVRDFFALGLTPISATDGATYEPAIPPEVGVASVRRRLRAALDPTGTLAPGDN